MSDKNTPFLKDAEGLENLDDEGVKRFTFDLNNTIKVINIKKK